VVASLLVHKAMTRVGILRAQYKHTRLSCEEAQWMGHDEYSYEL
jgi:hypothetical protein